MQDKLKINGKAALSRSDKTLAGPERDEIRIVAPRVWDATVGDRGGASRRSTFIEVSM